MSKTVRIVLYILSIITVAGVIAAFVFAGKNQAVMEPVEVSTEEAAKSAEGKNVEAAQENPAGETFIEETSAEEMPTETSTEENPAGETESAEDGNTTILFAGDVLFANAFKAGYDAKGVEGVVDMELLALLQDADIFMVNNEFPFSNRGTPMEDKQFTFCCPPSYVKALNDMGVDVVSLANNHTLDYGKEALSDTFTTLDGAGIFYGGAGETVERAEELQVIDVNGKKFGFLAVSRVIPETSWKVENSVPGIFSCYDDTRLVELVAEAKAQCDFVAVYPHWGVEYDAYPQNYQTTIARKCVEAGADIIVGSHTHCLQGAEFMDGKPVFYSLGNFIFGRSIDRSAVVRVTVAGTGETSYELIPVYAENGVTRLATGEQAEQILSYLDEISAGASVSSDGIVTQ